MLMSAVTFYADWIEPSELTRPRGSCIDCVGTRHLRLGIDLLAGDSFLFEVRRIIIFKLAQKYLNGCVLTM